MRDIFKLAVSLSLSLYAPGICDVIHVPADRPTIQQGIDLSISGDTVLVSDGVYSGNNNHDITFGGKAIMVKSVNGPEYTIIDCQGDQWTPRKGFLFLNEGRTTFLDGFTVKNGSTGPYCLQYSGGAIYCEGSPTIKNCRFVDNTNRENNCLYSGGGRCFAFWARLFWSTAFSRITTATISAARSTASTPRRYSMAVYFWEIPPSGGRQSIRIIPI
jgi:hypothetical protein